MTHSTFNTAQHLDTLSHIEKGVSLLCQSQITSTHCMCIYLPTYRELLNPEHEAISPDNFGRPICYSRRRRRPRVWPPKHISPSAVCGGERWWWVLLEIKYTSHQILQVQLIHELKYYTLIQRGMKTVALLMFIFTMFLYLSQTQ